MEKIDKELLFKDLCARLPYGVKCQFEDTVRIIDGESSPFYDYILSARHLDLFINFKNFYVKPYLRPMSSMTEEEEAIFEQLIKDVHYKARPSTALRLVDWLNKNMFDYRGLIPKNLAIEITEENNPYKD